MKDEYLWNKSGEPDPEIQRLESLLAPLGHQPGKAPRWPAARSNRLPWVLAVAAALLIVSGALWILRQRSSPAWQVAVVEGSLSRTKLATGESLATDSRSRVRLNLDDVGEVDVEPNSKLSVVTIKDEEHRLALDRGAIHALIWAPPGRFIVNTPSAQTVDLGCEYKLQVLPDGSGLVQVGLGWVAFENSGRESFIPATAACVTYPEKGPGIPYYEDASRALVDNVHRFDVSADPRAIAVILSEARPRDALTLWHLLRRVQPNDRAAVYDRLAQLITVPAGVTRDGVLSGNQQMVDALWNALDLGDTSWWRMWKSRGPK